MPSLNALLLTLLALQAFQRVASFDKLPIVLANAGPK